MVGGEGVTAALFKRHGVQVCMSRSSLRRQALPSAGKRA